LKLFNVSASDFLGSAEVDTSAELQKALARLGAVHLHENRDVLPSQKFTDVGNVVFETLIAGSPRLLTALAPVLVAQIGRLNLRRLDARLADVGLERRLPWLADNLLIALSEEEGTPLPRSWLKRYRRAEVVLSSYLQFSQSRRAPSDEDYPGLRDLLDPEIRAQRTLSTVWSNASATSRRWGIVTDLQPQDFARALKAARAHD